MSSSDDEPSGLQSLLSKKVYSPATLAEELSALAAGKLISEKSIRSAISTGQLTARRLVGRNIVIFRQDVIAWLENLPSAARRTRERSDEKRVPRRMMMSAAELAEESVRRERMRKRKQQWKSEKEPLG